VVNLMHCMESASSVLAELRNMPSLRTLWLPASCAERAVDAEAVCGITTLTKLAVVRTLLAAGADYEARDAGGWRPLHIAVREGHVDAAQLLVEAGADVEAPDDDGFKPLHLAADGGYVEVVRALVDAVVDVEAEAADGFRPLHYAARSGGHDWGAAGAGGGRTRRHRRWSHSASCRTQLGGSAVAAGGRG
jgi:ankyrin repeat protein